jgi:hypothetical protein
MLVSTDTTTPGILCPDMVAVTFIDAPEHPGKEVCATTRFADRLRPTAPRLAEIAARGGKACCSDNGTPKRL